ncbi:MAG TPA: hypothetical protein DCF33_00750, partial [Saprospirales bacterium]|nr:hypothetical protein [Saprospirales bacterium]
MDKLTRIFISYRRDDTDAVAENVYHHLKDAFGDVVFKDNLRIGPAEKWAEVIESNLQAAEVVLALVGNNWFVKNEHHRIRLELDDDWVRRELEFAINHGKRLIPVMINGEKVPLPLSFHHMPVLHDHFPSNQAIHVNARRLKEDLHKLIYEDLPALGIQPLRPPSDQAKEIDVLADYPLPIKPEKGKLPLPYVGLRHFDAAESFLFFGRDQEILQLLKKVESLAPDKRIILYHGRSGVGKSSLLTAGIYLRLKGKNWEVPKPRRRKREKGIAADLHELMQSADDCLPCLLALDQVEEIFSNPQEAPEKEIAELQSALQQFLQECPNARLLLSFRSDYFTLVRKILDDANIPYSEMELFPLTREAVLKAIVGVTDNPALRECYQLAFEPATLPQDICDDVLKDKNSSHVTTLLQYQLEKLFLKAAPDWKNQDQKPPVVITEAHYTPDFRKDNLEQLLDAEFEQLRSDWETHLDSGLLLDVLAGYITDQATAGSRPDQAVLADYEHVPDFPRFFDYLKNRRSLLAGIPSDNSEMVMARLSHDSLAPLLLARFNNSTAPGQRAWQVLEPKLKDLKNGLKPTLLGSDDLKIVEEGRHGMRALSLLEGLLSESAKAQQALETERRQNNTTIFNSFAHEGGERLILTLDHEKALENLQVAIEVDIDFPTKQATLRPLLEELLFFFAEGARRPELARRAAQLLLNLHPEASVATLLQRCCAEIWTEPGQFADLLPRLDSCHTLKNRYYPEMVAIGGGQFAMGSAKDEPGHRADETSHQVTVSDFRLATTPLTFYQYALYCEANAKSIISRSPAWGRFGDHPLVNISWYDALEYCNWLSKRLGLKEYYNITPEKDSDKNNHVPNDYLKWKVETDAQANGFRLPTEAEWEYAARGGNQSEGYRYAGSNVLDEVAWYWENSGDKPLSGIWNFQTILDNNGRTHPVRSKNKPNELGLFDMSGNVFEWCWDWYDKDYYDTCLADVESTNPTGPVSSAAGRVLRGG